MVHDNFKNEYGPIYKISGSFGKRDVIVLHDPKDFETIYRTAGQLPLRRGFDSLTYYREQYRKDKFPMSIGLLNEQGQKWWDLRHKVNDVMMKPQITKRYTIAVDEVARDFVKK